MLAIQGDVKEARSRKRKSVNQGGVNDDVVDVRNIGLLLDKDENMDTFPSLIELAMIDRKEELSEGGDVIVDSDNESVVDDDDGPS